ncbi:hypothetical protein PpBr36_04970 [Pyricularia pennisetigena]|uniref:hypothetical protein n=1 Tax=Pyricularia pennisetigena TaxID=1578925 RepID=UPI00114F16AC|nr:hypothetical protein PpBr36_04970 [Pyricularia pennisetigena]TLS26306.1 hypothetical protein PpBr36_04970 [Pyricularia pennisetigena]
MRSSLFAAFVPVAVVAQDAPAFPEGCLKLAGELNGKLPNTTVWFSEPVLAGTNITLSDTDPTCGRTSQKVDVDLCRVAMFVTTSPTSNVSVEAWLPVDWKGDRFLSTGNGGLSGCIQYEDMAYTTARGFATVSGNAGHNGTSGAAFGYSDEVVEDFSWRSVHTGVVLGKQIVEEYYGRPHQKSYYLGCSTGGRQGFKSAQDFPEDFDGVVAGAPAFAFNNLSSWSGHFYPATGKPGSPTFLSVEQWMAVQADVLKQCDGLDGHKDGILEDPDLCAYRPENLICGSGNNNNNNNNSTACITGTQAETVRKVFGGIYSVDGSLTYPGLQYGVDNSFVFIYLTGNPFVYSAEWFQYAIYHNPEWDPATLGPKDYAESASRDFGGISSFKGDLSGARDRGAKILHYHGLQDQIITSTNSARYYDHVSRTMNLPSRDLDAFYRYFRVSGMGHCNGGSGAGAIGNRGGDSYVSDDAADNVLTAIVDWVEKGVAPETITGTRYQNGTRSSGVIEYKRRHCRYPLRNVFKGGDANDPDSWQCV